MDRAEEKPSAVLAYLAVDGGISLPAAAAGVHRNRAYRRIDDDPAFPEEIELAKAYYRDLLECESVHLARRRDNRLPYSARSRPSPPSRYIDRQAVLLTTTTDTPAPSDGHALLQVMFGMSVLEPPEHLEAGYAGHFYPGLAS